VSKDNRIALVRDDLRRRMILRDAYDDVLRDMTSRGLEVGSLRVGREQVADNIKRQRDILNALEES
jgi:hypothetical protein